MKRFVVLILLPVSNKVGCSPAALTAKIYCNGSVNFNHRGEDLGMN